MNAIDPATGIHIWWSGLWMERAEGVSMNQLAYITRKSFVGETIALLQVRLKIEGGQLWAADLKTAAFRATVPTWARAASPPVPAGAASERCIASSWRGHLQGINSRQSGL